MASEMVLFAVFAMLVVGSQTWRRRRVRRAARDLPTRVQRMLGPEPEFDLPEGPLSEDLAGFAVVKRRTLWVQRAVWGVAGVWGGFVAYLMLGGMT